VLQKVPVWLCEVSSGGLHPTTYPSHTGKTTNRREDKEKHKKVSHFSEPGTLSNQKRVS